MTRVVGHTGAVASPLQSLSGAGEAAKGAASLASGSVFTQGAMVKNLQSFRDIPNQISGFSITTSDITGFDIAPHPSGGFYVMFLQGQGLHMAHITDLADFSNPANRILQSRSHGTGGFIRLNADGTKVFISSSSGTTFPNSGGIFTMSTPFDLSTLTYHSQGYDSSRGSLSPDGKYYVALDNDELRVRLYTPPVPWDLSNTGGLRWLGTGFDMDDGTGYARVDFITNDVFMICGGWASGPWPLASLERKVYPTFRIVKSGYSYSLEFEGMFAPRMVSGNHDDQGPRFVEGFGMFMPHQSGLMQFN